MPIRRAAATPPTQEKAPSADAEKEPEASDEESPSADEEQAASSAAGAEEDGEGENSGDAHADKNEDDAEDDGAEDEKKDKDVKCPDCEAGQCTTHCFVLLLRLKDGYKYEKSKTKKVKRTIPAWASVTASKNIPVTNYAGTQCKVDSILIEAIMSSKDKAGISFQSLMKYILKKYPNMELDKKKKFLIKKAMKKHVEKGTVKQLKGKGLSGRFAIGKKPPPAKKNAQKQESLGDALPLIFTRLCEPKEASYTLIKKYLKQHFPNFNIENRPDVLKTALGKAVEKGHLEQVTGKGAQGTFQLKHAGKDTQLKGSNLEDAITVAIVAMNEPKTCSATSLRKHLIDSNKDIKEHLVVSNLKRTLTKCKVLGWMKQLTGHGLNGTYGLSFPYYPSPTILYPDKFNELPNKPAKRRHTADSSDEEEEEEEEDEEEESESEDEAPPKRRTKVLSRANRRPPPTKRAQRASPSKAKSRGRTPAKKSPVKAAASSSAKKGGRKQAVAKKESTATPVKKGAPSRKPKKPAVKRLSQRTTKKPVYKESSPEPESEESEVEEAPTRGRSKPPKRESSPDESEPEEETKRGGSKRSKPESSPKAPKAGKAAARGGSKRSKPEETTPEEPPAKKQATKGGSKRQEPESTPEKPDVKKGKSSKRSTRKSKRGKN